MKYAYLLIVVFLFICKISYSAVRFDQGDKVNVWVLKGVTLYKESKSASANFGVIPYGKQIVILSSESDSLTSYQGRITNDITEVPVTLKGHWVKVKYGQKVGYVFDGYLSKMPCLKIEEYGSAEEFSKYVKRIYKGYTQKSNKSVVKGIDFEEKIYYYKGMVVLKETSGDGCFDTEIYLKGISYRDAQLFEKVYFNGATAAEDIKIKAIKNSIIKISCYSCT